MLNEVTYTHNINTSLYNSTVTFKAKSITIKSVIREGI